MDRFEITGGNRLTGEVTISGAKNAAVAIIPATVLSDGICKIENVPEITDVQITPDSLTVTTYAAETWEILDTFEIQKQ